MKEEKQGNKQTRGHGKAALLALLVLAMVWMTPGKAQAITAAQRAANEVKVFTFFVTEMKFPPAAACGIMGTMHHESGFIPDITSSAGAYGLCQWTGGRITSLKTFCANNGYDYRTVEGQLYFIKYELESYASLKSLVTYLRSVPNTAAGCYNAGYQWCYVFEMSSMGGSYATACSVTRATTGRDTYWKKYGTTATYATLQNVSGGFKLTISSNAKYGFVVKRKVKGGTYSVIANLTEKQKSLTDKNVAAGKTYVYQVFAKTADGKEGEASNEVSGTLSKMLTDSACKASLAKTSVTWTGKALTPAVTVTYSGTKLKKGTDYTLAWKNNKAVGTGSVTITGKGSYKGTLTLKFTITKAVQKITAKNLKVTYKNGTISSGVSAKGKITLVSSNKAVATVSGKKLRLRGAGKTQITIKAAATSAYAAAQKTITLTVVPSKPVLSSLKAKSPLGAVLTWKKAANPDGYEIQYTQAASFSGSPKTAEVSGSTGQLAMTGLVKGKTLRVRVRSFKVIDGTRVYSSWSKTKTLKISK